MILRICDDNSAETFPLTGATATFTVHTVDIVHTVHPPGQGLPSRLDVRQWNLNQLQIGPIPCASPPGSTTAESHAPAMHHAPRPEQQQHQQQHKIRHLDREPHCRRGPALLVSNREGDAAGDALRQAGGTASCCFRFVLQACGSWTGADSWLRRRCTLIVSMAIGGRRSYCSQMWVLGWMPRSPEADRWYAA